MVRYTTIDNMPIKKLPVYGPRIPVRPTFEAWWKHYMHLKKVSDYMFQIYIPYAHYKRGIEHIDSIQPQAGCSSFRVGKYHARNLDYFYDETAYFLTYIPRSERTPHASMAICGYVRSLTQEYVESGEWSDAYVYMPCYVVDGINDDGVTVNVNVVPSSDNPLDPTKENHITSTNPGKPRLPTAMVARYILDRAASVDEAIQELYTVDLYTNATALPGYEYHWMISDSVKTVVVEVVNNQIYIYDANKMTNFYITGFDGNVSNICLQEIEHYGLTRNPTVTKHAYGLERYRIIHDEMAKDSSLANVIFTLSKLRYTNAYKTTTSPFWYSEYFENYGGTTGDLTFNSSTDQFSEVIAAEIAKYNTGKRDGSVWRTMNSSVYNVSELRLMLQVQENDEMFTFSLKDFMKIDVDKLGDMTKWIEAPLPVHCFHPPKPCPIPPPKQYVEWDDILNKPDTFTPSPHKHKAEDIEGITQVNSFQIMRPPYEDTIWLVIEIFKDASMTDKLYTIDGRTTNGANFMKIDNGSGFVAVTKDGLGKLNECKLITVDLSSLSIESKVFVKWSWYAVDGDVVATSNFTYPSVTPFDPISMGLVWQGN